MVAKVAKRWGGWSVRSMIAVLDIAAGPRLRDVLDSYSHNDLRIVDCARSDEERFRSLLADAEVVLHVLQRFGRADFEAAPRLRLVQKLGVGVNTIALDVAAERGVAVANLPGVNASAVVEATLAGMLAALRQFPAYHDATKAGHGWGLAPSFGEASGEIRGRTVGLIGYGSIASSLAVVLESLGASVVHHSQRTDRPGWCPLDELLAKADVVSLHVPLTPDTDGLMSRDRLALMKKGAVLVNTARGGLVDQTALVDALRSGALRAAALDVFAHEPVDPSDPLLALPNVVLTPHTAWLTMETLERCIERAVLNCGRLVAGVDVLHRVV